MREGLTFTDVLLVPKYSDIETRKQLSTQTALSRRINLNIPIVSSNMDTVTEATMATRMAELGGIGIIHRFLTIDNQVSAVTKVKRSHNFVIAEPYTIPIDSTVGDVKLTMRKYDVDGLLVVNSEQRLCGIVTARDLLFEDEDTQVVEQVMTPFDQLICKEVTSSKDADYEEARQLLKKHKREKLPLIDQERRVKGLITVKDIQKRLEFPRAAKDSQGRLLVGAAIGVKNDYLERTHALVKAGVDVLVIDIAHGHSRQLLETMAQVKSELRYAVA